MVVCRACEHEWQQGWRVCPFCGTVPDLDCTSTDASVSPIAIVGISFGESAASWYAPAVALCRKAPGYRFEDGRHKIELPISNIEALVSIWDMVKGISTARLTINGQPASKKNLTMHGMACYREWLRARNKKTHCWGTKGCMRNVFGCSKLYLPTYAMLCGAQSRCPGDFQFGEKMKDGSFRFKMDAILGHLNDALDDYSLCPNINIRRIYEIVDGLPDVIKKSDVDAWMAGNTGIE